jgi:UDP-glucose 4-epimerase
MTTEHRTDLAALRDKRILITGGAGLIGSHLTDLLVRVPAREIVILDNLSRGGLDNLATTIDSGVVTFIEGDIRDRALLARAFSGIDVLFHLAAIRLTHCAEDPRLALEVMADGSFNVLEAAVEQRVGRVVAASSASIYGMAEQFPTDEAHHPWGNRTLYGAAKTFLEGLLASFKDMHGLDYVALRPFNVYGPRMDRQGAYTEVLIRWMERIDQGLPPVVFGDGGQTMDFVFVTDVARAMALAGASNRSGEVYNVASGVETSLDQLARALVEIMGSTLSVERGPPRPTAVPRRLANTHRAREHLGFEAEVPLQEGLRRLVQWWRAQPG